MFGRVGSGRCGELSKILPNALEAQTLEDGQGFVDDPVRRKTIVPKANGFFQAGKAKSDQSARAIVPLVGSSLAPAHSSCRDEPRDRRGGMPAYAAISVLADDDRHNRR